MQSVRHSGEENPRVQEAASEHPARGLMLCNPALSDLISEKIGDEWPVHLDQLKQLKQFAQDPKFQDDVMKVKQNNKNKLA